MSSALSSAVQDRKARLAHLKSLKNKQPSTAEITDSEIKDSPKQLKRKPDQQDADEEEPTDPKPEPETARYLSGRNYDATTKGPKLGFEAAPDAAQETLERRAEELARTAKTEVERQEAEDKPLDLSRIQPKKPNWDLKRDLDRKLDDLNVRTNNAIARLIRERIANAKEQQEKAQTITASTTTGAAAESTNGHDQSAQESEGSQTIGIDGSTLVEATRERERQDEEDARREEELDQDAGLEVS